jgi:tetrahydromethanopterin S-methyltransferase subunit A
VFVLDPQQPVSICTLGDPGLAHDLAQRGLRGVAIVGPMATENLGVEKLVRNVVANSAIRKVILVGPETGGTAPTGHYAGEALLCLQEHGVEPDSRRILRARGRRPFVRNLSLAEIDDFRRRVQLVDRRGVLDAGAVVEALETVSADRGACSPRLPERSVLPKVSREAPAEVRWVEATDLARGFQEDSFGYFLVFCDHPHGRLLVEHYSNEDLRTHVIAGQDPLAIVRAVIELELLGSLEHAAYLGRELERAAAALERGCAYLQDGGRS